MSLHNRGAWGVAGLLLSLVLGPVASAAPSAAGAWIEVVVNEGPEARLACRYVVVETRGYRLQPMENGRLQGNYTLIRSQLWLGRDDTCRVGGSEDLPPPRGDMWTAFGEQDVDGVAKLTVAAPQCFMNCTMGTAPIDTFKTLLKPQPGGYDDLGDGPEDNVRHLAPEADNNAAAEVAMAALSPLLQPLIAGDCNAFYAQSLHSDAQRIAPDLFCAVARPIGQILAPTLYDKPQFAYRVAKGRLWAPPNSPPRYFSRGDVLACRFFVLAANDQGVPICAVLRRDKAGAWKFVDFA